jgi:AraC-like DNA-binding protein
MPMGPLIYFYIRTMLDPSFRLERRHRLQFYAVIIDIMPAFIAALFFANFFYLKWFVVNPVPWGILLDEYDKYADIPRWTSMTVYVGLSYRYFRKIKQSMPGAEKLARTKWLQLFLAVFLVFQAIWFVYLVPYVIPAYSNKLLDLVDWYPIYIPMAVIIYWLGIKGYLVSYAEAETEKKKRRSIPAELSADTIRQTIQSLTKSMEEDRLYLNPALNLEVVATHAGIPAKTISAVLNQHREISFTEWVNGYRVKEFKQRIREKEYLEQMTLSAIALECGFNSQATFQRIFKQSAGMTPSEYLKTLQLST